MEDLDVFVNPTQSDEAEAAAAVDTEAAPPQENPKEETEQVPDAITPDPQDAAQSETDRKSGKKLDKMKRQRLCKLVKNDCLKKHPEVYHELVANPSYLCHKCGRAAKDQASLCKPVPIKEISS